MDKSGFSSFNGVLHYDGRPILHEVPSYVNISSFSNISSTEPPLLSSSSSSEGVFIGFNADTSTHTHIFSMGKLKDTRFSSIFRFKLWWTTHWIGNKGSDVEKETQILILDTHRKAQFDDVWEYPYIIFLPILEGSFRASLQGGIHDNVDVCVESGSTLVCEKTFKSCVYVHACKDPFLLVKDALKVVKAHMGTFKLLEEKVVPSIVNKFGWCTWDAFYLGVHPGGVRDGLQALVEGGVPPKFLIIDDGWQSIASDDQDRLQDATLQTVAGDQMRCRLIRVRENGKFSNYTRGSLFEKKFNGEDSILDGVVRASSDICKSITDVARMHLHACDSIVDAGGTRKDSHASKHEGAKETAHSNTDEGARLGLHACDSTVNAGAKMTCYSETDDTARMGSQGFEGVVDEKRRNGSHACPSIIDEGARTSLIHACDNSTCEGGPKVGSHPCHSNKGAILGSHAFRCDQEQACRRSGGCYPKTNNCSVIEDAYNLEQDIKGLKALINDLKMVYPSLDDVYVWHALAGYWGGVRPSVDDAFGAELVQPVLAPGVSETMEDLAVDKIVSNSIGLVPPENIFKFYDNMHSYLAQHGVSGVKLDVIQILELLGEKHGGRVELNKAYYKGLDESVRKNFGGNRVIASMEHSNDFMLLGTQQLALGRVGDDFWPEDADGNPLLWLQGFHMVHCAYNSLWMGQFIRPDWDMFQTTHHCAPFHAASRAISGGPIYVSDKPGQHNYSLLKRIVFPDGTTPGCEHFALPTRDCLFVNPMNDGMTVLKIWNLNKCGGVIGAFNCQGGGWSRENRTTMPSSTHPSACFARVSPSDIEWSHVLKKSELFAIYSIQLDKISILKRNESLNIKVEPLDYDIFTVCALHLMGENLSFAPIGLVNMLNSGGSVESIVSSEKNVVLKVRGAGKFCAYANFKPILCKLDCILVDFLYNSLDGRVTVELPWKEDSSTLEFVF